MATLLTTYYGNTVTAGTSKQFRVIAELYSTQENSSKGYYLQVKYYVEVLVGQSSPFTRYFQVSWDSGVDYSLSTVGTYATKTVDLGWVAYGSSKTITASGQYEGTSGTIYKSSLSGTYTVPAKSNITIQFNANGGTSAPNAIVGTAGSITLPSTVPIREGHTFMGWTAQASSTNERHTSISSSGVLTNYARPSLYDRTYIQRVSVGRVNNTTWEVLAYATSGTSKVAVYTWSNYEGQDDLTHEYLDSGSWTRGSYTYNFGKQIKIDPHIKSKSYKDLIDYFMHIYAYDSSNNTLESVAIDGTYVLNGRYLFDVSFLPGDTYPYDFNLTLYAQWIPNTLTVKYNANGGYVANKDYFYVGTDTGTIGYKPEGEGSGRHWADGWVYNEPQPNGLQNPESFTLYKTGYVFEGWCLNADGTGTILDPYDPEVVPTDIYPDIKTSRVNTALLYAIWRVSSDQSVYIFEDGRVYARAFIEDTSIYIDSTGAIHAPAFVTGSAFSLDESGVTATEFIEGTP